LTLAGMASFFIYRDPRDVIVSHVFYATEIYPGHGMHRYYTETLSNMEQRINAAIKGVQEPNAKLSSIFAKYEHYLGWLQQPGVLALRFEDLIMDRRAALSRVLDHLATDGFDPQPRQQAIDALEAGLRPGASGTFRRGQTGDWRQHFTEANKQAFKSETGDLLKKLGYEKDAEW
jgi:sulfotransferase 6B1